MEINGLGAFISLAVIVWALAWCTVNRNQVELEKIKLEASNDQTD